MKKVLLTAVAVFGLVAANAQEVKYGAKLGLNMSNFAGDAEEADMKIGFQVGGFAEIKVSDKFSVQPELVYSAQGSKTEESVSSTFFSYSSKTTTNMSYINIPVMAKYYATEKLFIEAGPQIGFLMSAKDKTESTQTSMGITTSDSSTDDFKKYANSTDFGLGLGLGYNFTENVGAGLRYNTGLSNIVKDAPAGYKVTNTNIALSIAYTF